MQDCDKFIIEEDSDKQLIKEIDPKFNCSNTVIIYEDNQGEISLVDNH